MVSPGLPLVPVADFALVSLPIASIRPFSATLDMFSPICRAVSKSPLSMYKHVDTLLLMVTCNAI